MKWKAPRKDDNGELLEVLAELRGLDTAIAELDRRRLTAQKAPLVFDPESVAAIESQRRELAERRDKLESRLQSTGLPQTPRLSELKPKM